MKLFRFSALALILLGVPAWATAQGTSTLPRGNVSGFAAFAANSSEGLDGGSGFGFSAAYFFSDMVGVEGGFRRQGFTAIETGDNLLLGGDLNANVITVNVVARFASGRAQPYVTGGVAFFSNDYSTDSSIAQQLEALNFSSGDLVDNTVGFNIGGGVDIQASSRVGVFFEGRYFIATADTVSSLTDTISMITSSTPGEQVMNFLAINAGVRIFF